MQVLPALVAPAPWGSTTETGDPGDHPLQISWASRAAHPGRTPTTTHLPTTWPRVPLGLAPGSPPVPMGLTRGTPAPLAAQGVPGVVPHLEGCRKRTPPWEGG